MRNILLLARTGFFNSWGGSSKKKTRSRMGKSSVMLIGSVALLLLIGFYANMLADLFAFAGRPEILITLGAALGMIMAIFFGISKTPASLFAAKDVEQLLAMPIGVTSVFLSKLAIVYSFSFTGFAGGTLPFAVVYGVRFGAGIGFYIALVAALLLVPMLLCTVSGLIGLLISAIARHFKSTNAAMMVLTIGFFALYFGFFFSISGNTDAEIITLMTGLGDWLAGFLPTGLVLRAAMGEWLSLLYMAALCVLPLALFAVVFAKPFRSINLALREKHMRGGFKADAIAKSSEAKAPFLALAAREFKMYFSRYYYVLNTAVGSLMLVLFTGMMVLGVGMFESMGDISAAIAPLYTVIACFAVTMAPTTASSISLEGNSLWILKSLPVDENSIFKAKLLVQLAITLPVVLLCGVVLTFARGLPLKDALVIFIVPAALSLMGAVMGLATNLRFPMLEWKNPMIPVKRGTSVMICIFATMALVALSVFVYLNLKVDFTLFAAVVTVIVLLATFAMWAWIRKAGKRRFKAL